MTRSLKITSYIIGSLVLIFIIAVILITKMVNPNDYKPQIENYVKTHTGRSLKIQGNLSWSFFPSLGFEARNVTIGNPPNFEKPDFANVKDMRFKVHFWSLVSSKLEIKEITLIDPTINMITNAENQTNWSNWKNPTASNNTTTATQPSPKEKEKQKAPERNEFHTKQQLSINAINIKNGHIHIIDRNTHSKWHFDNVNLSLKNFNSKQSFPITLSYDFSQTGSNNKIHSSFSANANIDLKTGNLEVPHVSIKNKIYRPNQPTYAANFSGNLNFDPGTQILTLKDTSIDLANMHITGSFSVSDLFIKPSLHMQFSSSNTKIGSFLHTIYGTDIITGNLNYNFELNSNGFNTQEIISNVNGQGQFKLTNGSLKYINLVSILAEASARLQSKSTPKKNNNSNSNSNNKNQTAYSSITGSFTAKDGTISNQDLKLNSSNVIATGQGTVDLKSEKINYKLNVKYQHNDQANTNFSLPILIAGTMDHPLVQPDFEAILGNIISNKIKSLINKDGSKSKGSIGSKFRELFGK